MGATGVALMGRRPVLPSLGIFGFGGEVGSGERGRLGLLFGMQVPAGLIDQGVQLQDERMGRKI